MLIALCFMLRVCAQDDNAAYRRSSIYSLMVKHRNQEYSEDISRVFSVMPVPEKYNEHDLSVKVVSIDEKKLKDSTDVSEFLNRNMVASRLVGKWFNRDVVTGTCDMELIKERGAYNSGAFDRELAKYSVRGNAMLEDAGEDLIGNTFVLVNDIRYINKATGSQVFANVVRVIGAISDMQSGKVASGNNKNSMEDMAAMIETYKGFKVKIHTYLYQLIWDSESSSLFYRDCYADTPSNEKSANFDRLRGKFKLQYIGEQESSGSKTSFLGINEEEPMLMVRKACQRALDENVANLQRNFDVFKVKVPLISVEPLMADIGKKEGITENSKFEVLETVTDKNGKTKYNRVGVIAPVTGKIWDNRFMAQEEGAEGADYKYTTFRKISGGRFYKGMLIREIK